MDTLSQPPACAKIPTNPSILICIRRCMSGFLPEPGPPNHHNQCNGRYPHSGGSDDAPRLRRNNQLTEGIPPCPLFYPVRKPVHHSSRRFLPCSCCSPRLILFNREEPIQGRWLPRLLPCRPAPLLLHFLIMKLGSSPLFPFIEIT